MSGKSRNFALGNEKRRRAKPTAMPKSSLPQFPMMSIINSVRGAQFAQVSYVSDVKLAGGKKNPLQGRVMKYVELNCQFNYDYENAVNNRLKKVDMPQTFVTESLPWGMWLMPNKVITHNGVNYLRVYEHKNGKADVTYYVDGHLATDDEIAQIEATLPKKSPSGTQGAVGLDENQVKPKNIKFENVLTFKCNGQTYTNPNPKLAV